MTQPTTILCLASYLKGIEFMREAKRLGCHVILVMKDDLVNEPWPWESIDEHFQIPSVVKQPDITNAVSYLARDHQIDRIVPLDDYDVGTAAALREHMRIPGMGDTTVRHFRDKLAMRVQARDRGIPVPDFVHVLNYDRLREFMDRVPAPWVLKPRSEAGSMGIKKVNHSEELWRSLDTLGDAQSNYVLEKFLPGDVYHVDSIVTEREVVFSVSHKYGMPPMTVYQGGGVFMTRGLARDGEEDQALQQINREVLAAMNMVRGVSHAEFIRAHEDGRYYFLEIAARVGGANIDKMVEAATGVQLWAEWAKIEVAHARGEAYHPPASRSDYAGLIVSLARQEWPDLAGYTDGEIVWRLNKKHHAGMIVASYDPARIESLLADYAPRFAYDFMAVAPPEEKGRV
jgi:biotin carboxylase